MDSSEINLSTEVAQSNQNSLICHVNPSIPFRYELIMPLNNQDLVMAEILCADLSWVKNSVVQCDLAAIAAAKKLASRGEMLVTFNVSLKTIYLNGDSWRDVAVSMGGLDGLAVEICEQEPDCVFEHDLLIKKIVAFAGVIKFLGGSVALDDFGDGFLFGVLLNLVEPDILKINLSHLLIQTEAWLDINDYAKRNPLCLVVERIETHEQLVLVQSFSRVTHIQGFLYNKQKMLVDPEE